MRAGPSHWRKKAQAAYNLRAAQDIAAVRAAQLKKPFEELCETASAFVKEHPEGTISELAAELKVEWGVAAGVLSAIYIDRRNGIPMLVYRAYIDYARDPVAASMIPNVS